MIWAIVDTQTNLIVNMITWDGVSQWSPPENCIAVEHTEAMDVASIGWSYIDGQFIAPPEPEIVIEEVDTEYSNVSTSNVSTSNVSSNGV